MDWKYLLTSYQGRINRAKFWAGVGLLVAAGIVVNILDAALGLHIGEYPFGILAIIATPFYIYLALAVYTKRWHDRDKSGWWSLIGLVPVIGGVWLIVELGILEGTRGANRFGPDPLA
ncbi:DUF805 domain-containing protein [Corticibacterium sp. UT-5YL-CI-8]|nr:DUF805 domain-containing protein [Tianweitania sp. UT-5YL-CI-8]